MKFFLFNFLIVIVFLFLSVFSIIPLWNFENTAINLLSQSNTHTYLLYLNTIGEILIKLEKTITKNEDCITEINTLYIGNDEIQTDWDKIESIYSINNNIYICPQGKNHMNKYENGDFIEMKPDSFSYEENWELLCYHQINKNYMFVSYLNRHNLIYVYKFDTSEWITNSATSIYNGLYDFKWTTDAIDSDISKYPMKMIVNDNNKMRLIGTLFTINNDGIYRDDQIFRDLIDSLTYSNSYFNDFYDQFYFITFDKDPPNFKSGYFTESEYFDYSNIESISINTNSTSPLDFYYNFTIKKMEFNRYTNYVLYEIYNTIKNKTYYGVIDIILNKVIFNTDVKIIKFKPYSSESFLAITDKSAYKICAIYEDNDCISLCYEGNLYIDSQRPNFCGNKCSKYLLVPTGICVDECDENIFHTEDNYHCGFCKDINITSPYKILNKTGCYNTIPNGTYLYNSKYYLLKEEERIPMTIPKIELCNKNEDLYPVDYGNNTKEIKCYNKNDIIPRIYFDIIDEVFKPCYETCYICDIKGNKTYHNCIECEPGYKFKPEGFPKNNCVVSCPYYYFNVYNQYKCIEELPCPSEAKLLVPEKKKCINDCKKDDTFKYQYNGKCYKECPEGKINNSFICEDDSNTFILTKNELNLNYTSFIKEIDSFVKTYSEEFSYTNKHVTEYTNIEYNGIIYKDKEIINKLPLNFPSVNFGNCYEKIQIKYNISQELIIVVINKEDNDNNPSTSYSFFDPKTGDKLETDICNNDTILVVENFYSFLNNNLTNYKSMINLIEQGINIFNNSDEFYSNLCYEYNLNIDKDIALQDRIKLFYPNLSLCDSGCVQSSINLINMTANCECQFNDISNSNKDESKGENILLENILGNVLDFIDTSNIGVAKCYKKSIKFIIKSYGFYISLFLFIVDIIFSIIFYVIGLNKIKIYIYENTQNYFKLIGNSDNFNNSPPLKKNIKNKNNSKKKNENEEKDKIIFGTNNTQTSSTKKKYKKQNNNNKSNRSSLTIMTKTKNKPLKIKESSKENIIQSSLKLKNGISKSKFTNAKVGGEDATSKKNLEIEKYKLYFNEYFESSLDEMEYDDAIRKDKRTFYESFIDKLKDKQIICNTFISFDILKPRSIKIILFILNLLFYFVINALFINDDYISEVYNLEKKDNFLSFIPRSVSRIFNATVINIIIGYIVDFFFVEEKKMKRIYLREKNNKIALKEQIISFSKSIKIHYIAFIIFVFIIILVCLYYLICFNSVYPKIQIEWIKSSIFIFLIIQFISLLQCLLETILRFMSLYFKSEKIFKISKLID